MTYRTFGAVAAVLALLPAAALAQAIDLTPYSGRILSDPEFLPLTGQLYGTSAYSHGWASGNSVYAAGGQSSFDVNTNTLDQYLAYGITDDLSLNASVRYALANDRETSFANGDRVYSDTSGFSDPTFGATWRALDQNAFPANFDVFGSYTPDWIGAHTATADQDGSIARGGDSGIIGAALGVVTNGFTIRGAFDANFLGQSSVLNLANGDVVQTGSHTNFDLSLQTQTRLTDLFSVNAGVVQTFASNANVTNVSTGSPRYSEPGDLTALQLALNYNFIPNAFVISGTYEHDFYGNSSTLYPNPVFNTETQNRGAKVVGVKLTYATP